MEHLSSATVNAIVKQIKDLQKNPAEGITVRSLVLFLYFYRIVLMHDAFCRRLRRGRLELGFRFLFPFLLKGAWCFRAQNSP